MLILRSTTFIKIIFKYSVLTSKIKQRVSITKINWFMLFREITAVYSENHTKIINTLCGLNTEFVNVIACAIYRCHCALECYNVYYWWLALVNTVMNHQIPYKYFTPWS
jgi:hypothetical protein